MGQVSTEDLAARNRLKCVKEQIEQAQSAPPGTIRQILCPYCDTLNTENHSVCCDTLRKAIVTVLIGQRQTDIENHARRHGN